MDNSLKTHFKAAMLAVPLLVSAHVDAGQGRILSVKLNERLFEVFCDDDFKNGKPSIRFLNRLEEHLTGTNHGLNFNRKLAIEHIETHSSNINKAFLIPAAKACAAPA
jgi:uncharacterized protein YjaG (DUF416 family)